MDARPCAIPESSWACAAAPGGHNRRCGIPALPGGDGALARMQGNTALELLSDRLLRRKYQRVLLVIGLLLLCSRVTYVADIILLILQSEMVFSHLFYLPVAVAGFWWGIRGIWIAVLLGGAWVVSYFLARPDIPLQEYLPQPVIFIIIGATIGLLREQTLRSERNLLNRVKELDCLFAISTLREQTDLTIPTLLQQTLELIPPAWQYPAITGACITIDQQVYQTANFAATPWQQVSPIIVHGKPAGQLTVCYLAEQPAADEGPFLREERHLLNAIAERLGKFIERERALAALRRSEATNRALVSAIPDIIWRIRADGTLLDLRGARDFDPQLISDTFIGKHVREVFPDDVARHALDRIARTMQTGDTQVYEYQLLVDGTVHSHEARFVISGENEVLAIIRDITERKTREALLEEERLRIARDLHDGLAQSLYFLGLKLDYLRKQVTRDPEGVSKELLTLKGITQASIQEVRRTIFALRPINLERLGFETAIRQYAREFGEHMGLCIDLNIEGDPHHLSHAVELVFFRLIQEGLNNVGKHAHAHHVWIDLYIMAGRTGQLLIRDDGVGFDPHTLMPTGGKIGLNQMQERVTALGGLFTVESTSTTGTVLRAEIPL